MKAAKIFLYVWISAFITIGILSPNKVNQLSETTKNIYFHVSVAFTCVLAFVVSAYFSFKYLRTKILLYDIKASVAAALGLMFCTVTTFQGMMWARYAWGAFWSWDPRQTSILMLLILEAAYFVLRQSVDAHEKRASLSAVYSVFSFLPMIFLAFVLPRLVGGLHPGSDAGDVNPAVSQTTDALIRVVLYSMFAGLAGIFFWLHNLGVRYQVLQNLFDEAIETSDVAQVENLETVSK
jgi:heme exporter protein C